MGTLLHLLFEVLALSFCSFSTLLGRFHALLEGLLIMQQLIIQSLQVADLACLLEQ